MNRTEYNDEIESENGRKRPVRSLADLIAELPKVPAAQQRGGINSAFNAAVFDVIQFLGEAPRHGLFAFWCGRLRGISPQDLYGWMSRAKQEGRKPQALFMWHLKKHREKYPLSNRRTKKKVIHTQSVQPSQGGI